jgi:VanZ family protein
MSRILQIVGWLLAVAITVLSLVPPQHRVGTAAPHYLEHLAAFLLLGVAFAAGYRDRLRAVAIGLVSFSGAIELAQVWAPGRHARLSDLLVDATAALTGLTLVWLAVHFQVKRRGFRIIQARHQL